MSRAPSCFVWRKPDTDLPRRSAWECPSHCSKSLPGSILAKFSDHQVPQAGRWLERLVRSPRIQTDDEVSRVSGAIFSSGVRLSRFHPSFIGPPPWPAARLPRCRTARLLVGREIQRQETECRPSLRPSSVVSKAGDRCAFPDARHCPV